MPESQTAVGFSRRLPFETEVGAQAQRPGRPQPPMPTAVAKAPTTIGNGAISNGG
jgi:hypothetical protein